MQIDLYYLICLAKDVSIDGTPSRCSKTEQTRAIRAETVSIAPHLLLASAADTADIP